MEFSFQTAVGWLKEIESTEDLGNRNAGFHIQKMG
jgi:hypothetical protein